MRLGIWASAVNLAVMILVVSLSGLVTLGGEQPAAEPTGSLAGTVADLDGRPVRQGRAWIESRKKRGKVVAAAAIQPDGRFRIGPVSIACHAVLLVESAGYAREYREEVSIFRDSTTDVQVVLAPGRSVKGRAIAPDGRPATNLPLKAEFFRYEMGHTYDNFGPARTAKTDADGGFVLADVPPCALVIETGMPTSARAWQEENVLPGVGFQTMPPLSLAPDVPISGTVSDEGGKMLPNVKVDTNFAGDRLATTDASGRFVLRGFSADLVPHVRFRIIHPAYAYYESEPVGKASGSVKIVLKREHCLSGRLVDADTGEPVQIKSMILCTFERRKNGEILRGGCGTIRFRQPEKGSFRVAYDLPQDFHLTVTAEGYADAEALINSPRSYKDVTGITIKAHRQRTSAPEVLPIQTIAGKLTRDGRPITAAWITLWEPYKERTLPNASVRRGRTVTTGGYIAQAVVPSPSGTYSLHVPHQGPCYVVVEEPNRAPTVRGPLEIALNETLKLDLALEHGGRISGRIRGIRADSASGWWVVAFDRTVWKAEARVSKDGTFRLDRLPRGVYGLKVGHDGFHDPDVPRLGFLAEKLPEDVWTTPARPWHGATIVTLLEDRPVDDVVLDLPPPAVARSQR